MRGIRYGFLNNELVQTVCQCALGSIFIFASIDKIFHPIQFSKIIENYQLLPKTFIIAFAVIIPWIELSFGIFLFLGYFPKLSAFILSSLITIFIIAILINAIRGININCGCFSTSPEDIKPNILFLIIRDLLFLIPGLVILFFSNRPIRIVKKAKI